MSAEKIQINKMQFWKLFPETKAEEQQRVAQNQNAVDAGDYIRQCDLLIDRYPSYAKDIEESRQAGYDDLAIEKIFVNREKELRENGMTQQQCDEHFGRTRETKDIALAHAEWLKPKIRALTGLSDETIDLRLTEAKEFGEDIGLLLNEEYYKAMPVHLEFFKSSEEAMRSAALVQTLANQQAHTVWDMMNSDQSNAAHIEKCQKEIKSLSDQIYNETRKRPYGFQQNVAYSSTNLGIQLLQGMSESSNKIWLYGAGALALAATAASAGAPLAVAGGAGAVLANAAGAAMSATIADGVFTNTSIREAAETYQNLRNKNLSHSEARLWAIGAGAVKAGIEVNVASRLMKAYGLGDLVKGSAKFPSLTHLFTKEANKEAMQAFAKEGGVEKLLAEKGFRDFVIDRMKDFGVDVVANTAEEVQQEFVDVAVECMAAAIAKNPGLKPKDALARLTETAKSASKEFFYGMLPSVGISTGRAVGQEIRVSEKLGFAASKAYAASQKKSQKNQQSSNMTLTDADADDTTIVENGVVKEQDEQGKILRLYPDESKAVIEIAYVKNEKELLQNTVPGSQVPKSV